jgi:hypothetical protein
MIFLSRKDFVRLENIVDVIIFFVASLSDSKYFYVEEEIPHVHCVARERRRAWHQQLNNTHQLIYLISSWEVSIEFVAQSSNFTLSSSSSLLRRCGRDEPAVVDREFLSPRKLAGKNTLLRNRPAVLVCQRTENPCSPLDDTPRTAVASHPLRADLSLSLDRGSHDEGRS